MNGQGNAPQLVLQVPSEVIRLLTAILSGIQRLEAEAQDIKKRLAWQRPTLAVELPPATPVAAAGQMPIRSVAARGPGSSHTPAGPQAAARIKALQQSLQVSGARLAARLGIAQTMVWKISRSQGGISHVVHEAMKKLEAV